MTEWVGGSVGRRLGYLECSVPRVRGQLLYREAVLQAPFGTVEASVAELDFNRGMCGVRVAVEWNYKDLKQYWS